VLLLLTSLQTSALAVAPAEDTSWVTTVVGWFHDPTSLLLAMGPWVLWGTLAIVFIESGVLFPVLPGDSLLFTAGLLHERLGLSLPMLVGLTFVAAFLGAQIGYWLGRRFGRRLFRDDARFLRTEHLDKAEDYFTRYGGRSLVIGRFIPFVRTFIPLAAGIARYPYGKFLAFNSLGALLWGSGVTYAGSILGGVQFVHDNLSMLILLIVFVSLLPMVAQAIVARRKAGEAPSPAGSGSADRDTDEGAPADAPAAD
jgi:membrane-associated protein